MSLSDELCRSYLDLKWHFDPAGGALAGVPGTSGRLGHFDVASLRAHVAAFRAIEAGIEELEVEDSADELDRTALLDDVRVTLFRLQHERPNERNPAFWLKHLCDALWALRRATGPADRVALDCLTEVPRFLSDARATLSQPPAAFIDAARALTGPAAALLSGLAAIEGGGEPAQAAAAAEAALARFQLLLDTELSAHADEHAFATGPEHFDRLLHHEHAIIAGAPELWRAILRLEEEQEGELRDLADQLGRGGDWRAALLERQQAFAPADIMEFLTHGMKQRREAADRAGLLLVPELPLFERMPEHAAQFEPLASYRPPSHAGPATIFVSDRPAVRMAMPALLTELAGPGMQVQGIRAATLPSEVRRAISENSGWGLYAIELLEQAGGWPDLDTRLIIRAHVLYRVLLARLDIGLHTRQIGLAEAVTSLTERLPLQPFEALAAVRGILLEPTRAAGTIAGRRELLRLRDDRMEKEGAAFSPRRHHEEVLHFGGLPVPLIRWGLGLEA
ncbi:MAG TPA: DUF885 family protein [Gemmatimonadales bacterium]